MINVYLSNLISVFEFSLRVETSGRVIVTAAPAVVVSHNIILASVVVMVAAADFDTYD